MAAPQASANSIAIARLAEERRQWRRDHPFGFYAKPATLPDGSLNLLLWDCGIPGKAGTPWEGGVYPLRIEFSERYPAEAPRCKFVPPIPHPNIFPSGSICLSLLSNWRPSVTLRELLLGVQQLLEEPNLKSPANQEMYTLLRMNREAYERHVRAWAIKFKPQ